MKKSIAALLCLLAFSAGAQKLSSSKVPAPVKERFSKLFPAVKNEQWMKETDGGYEAAFKVKGQEMSATFDAAGIWKETETEIEISGLPAASVKYVQEHYKGNRIKEASKLNLADGSINYEAEVQGTDLIFDANGAFLKTAKP